MRVCFFPECISCILFDVKKNPLIITTSAEPPQVPPWLIINRGYARAVETYGGTLVMLTNTLKAHAEHVGNMMDGLLLPGGGDIDPRLYHQHKKKYSQDIDRPRDTIETILMKIALKRRVPILGICRGMEMINVHLGGTLYQDLHAEMHSPITHFNVIKNTDQDHIAHTVSIIKNSMLYTILGKESLAVNSIHHQGVNKLGTGLMVSATSSDGLAEAIELPNYPFLIGVQWHPERLIKNKMWLKLFKAFVDTSTQYSLKK